jgi:hypothetical protein
VEKKDADGKDVGGDLSDVALNWMVAQAQAAGIPLKELSNGLKIVSSPILHDQRKVRPWTNPLLGGADSEREFRYPNAPDGPSPVHTQTDAPVEGLTTPGAEAFINRTFPAGNNVGLVDMKKYAEWLRNNADYGHLDMNN